MNPLIRFIRNFAGALGILLAVSCASRQSLALGPAGNHPEKELAARVAARPQLAVLFVGNSLSFGMPRAFSKLASANGKNTRVGLCATNGWSLQRHAADKDTLDQIRDGHWDIIVLQEYSEIPAMNRHARAAAMFPPLRELVTAVRSSGAIPILYQTWGLRDGSRWRPGDDFHLMNGRIREGYHAASTNAGHLFIVPVGDSWESEFSLGRAGELFLKDGKHPAPFGIAVTARVFYKALFGQK